MFCDGFEVVDVVQKLNCLVGLARDTPCLIVWDLSKLTYVPWLKIVPMAKALGEIRERLDQTVSGSIVLLPNNMWRLALTSFLSLYKPSRDVQVVVSRQEVDVESQVTLG